MNFFMMETLVFNHVSSLLVQDKFKKAAPRSRVLVLLGFTADFDT